MKELSSWLIAIFLILYWGFRVVGAIMFTLGKEFAIVPTNITIEVVLLFVVLGMVPFIFKRQLWAGIVVLAGYGFYLGPDLFQKIQSLANNGSGALSQSFTIALFMDVIGIALALFAILDILWDKKRTKNPVDKKTDWYYKDDKYDRNLDDRADKNNYRMY